MMATNPELVTEREKATFNVTELTTLIDEGEENTKERKKMEKFYYEDPNMPDTLALYNLSSDDLYRSDMKTAKYFEAKLSKLDLPVLAANSQSPRSGHIRYIAHPAENPIALNSVMFRPTILLHGTPELQAKLMPLIQEQKVIGTYAQTELGHGTNIRELETTATYDPKTEEFVLHSPTLTSIKCWPNGIGRSCNYAIVMAQLCINGICHGIHMFLVQLRSLDDHSPLPGITLGELGPKMGMQGTDNGFIRFDHVRIPREQMLMNHAKVLKDGTYVKPQFDRVSYGMMVFVRVAVVHLSSIHLGQASTIAVRYNAVRRQGVVESGTPEVKIIDYQTQQAKLFPQVALAYAMQFTFQKLKQFHFQIVTENDTTKFNESHALACGLKALSSSTCSEGVEICRRACGGLGYLHATRLPSLYALAVAACTYEGDNTILLLQTARFLVKSMKMIADGNQVGSTVEYLKGCKKSVNQKSCMDEFVNDYELTSTRMIKVVIEKLATAVAQGKKMELAWHEHTVALTRCAALHSQVYVMHCLRDFLCNTSLSKELRVILEQLFTLLSIQWLLENAREFVKFGGVSKERLQNLDSRIPDLLRDLRPNIVSLVDAFDFCDASLHSVIGCYDGRVYERLYEYWEKLPANVRQRPNCNPVKAHL